MKIYGNKIGPNVEELVAKKLKNNPRMSREQALEEVIEHASDSRKWINYIFGLGGGA